MILNILGTDYQLLRKDYKEDVVFACCGAGGYCDNIEKRIVLCNMETFPGYEIRPPKYIEDLMKQILKHEIVHAFLYESGLGSNSNETEDGWAVNEEMVDWVAIQLPKIAKVFDEGMKIFKPTSKSKINKKKEE